MFRFLKTLSKNIFDMINHKRGNVLQRNIEPTSRNKCCVGKQKVLHIMIV